MISPVWDEDVTILIQAVPFSIVVLEKLCLVKIPERKKSKSKLIINKSLILQLIVNLSIVSFWSNFPQSLKSAYYLKRHIISYNIVWTFCRIWKAPS